MIVENIYMGERYDRLMFKPSFKSIKYEWFNNSLETCFKTFYFIMPDKFLRKTEIPIKNLIWVYKTRFLTTHYHLILMLHVYSLWPATPAINHSATWNPDYAE